MAINGKSFCITGSTSCNRSDLERFIVANGGIAKTSVSSKLDYLVLGSDAGKTKSAKATQFGVKVISENDLYEMVGCAVEPKKPNALELNGEMDY